MRAKPPTSKGVYLNDLSNKVETAIRRNFERVTNEPVEGDEEEETK